MGEEQRKSWVETRGLVQRQRLEYLIVRAAGPEQSAWEFPGGRVERRESPEAALRRICQATLGIEIEVHVGQPPFLYNFGTHSITYRYHSCGLVGGELVAAPGLEARWILVGQLREYLFEPAVQQVVDWLLEQPENA
jgi:mutator protein MutT